MEGLFDTYRGLLGGLAVAFWKQFGRPSGGLLGPLLGFLGASWGLVGASWAPAGGLGGYLSGKGSACEFRFRLLRPYSGPLGGFWSSLGRLLELYGGSM